jgi:hypothetical protein
MLDGLRHAPAGEGGPHMAVIHDTTMTPGKLELPATARAVTP